MSSSSESDDIVSETELEKHLGARSAGPAAGGKDEGRVHRSSVSAEAYGAWNQLQNFKPPVFPKNEDQKHRLKEVIAKCFIFGSLEHENEINILVDAFNERRVKEGETVIREGEAGDFLFVVESGEFEIFKKEGETNKKIKTMTSGDVIGELALLYNSPRSATVTASKDGIIWVLDRQSFAVIVRGSAVAKRERYMEFIKKVEILQSLTDYEKFTIIDAFRAKTYVPETEIVKQGDLGDLFYILESGTADAIKNGKVVRHYKSGDYFGELALLNNAKRAATVKATGDAPVRCLTIDRGAFERLFGPLQEILSKRAAIYVRGGTEESMEGSSSDSSSSSSSSSEGKASDASPTSPGGQAPAPVAAPTS